MGVVLVQDLLTCCPLLFVPCSCWLFVLVTHKTERNLQENPSGQLGSRVSAAAHNLFIDQEIIKGRIIGAKPYIFTVN